MPIKHSEKKPEHNVVECPEPVQMPIKHSEKKLEHNVVEPKMKDDPPNTQQNDLTKDFNDESPNGLFDVRLFYIICRTKY